MKRIVFAASMIALACAVSGPASALSTQECSTKYQAAKSAGTLNGQKWNDFRKANCGAGAEPAAATTPAPAPPPAAAPKEAAKEAPKPAPSPAATTTAAKPAPAPTAAGAPAFPKAVDPKYASESAGKARQKTCLDQYNANKAAGGNSLKWIEKGGGYYSECNKRLKG